MNNELKSFERDSVTERPISIAIVAMGGQGGGVLTEWIVHLAESQGWVAQSTSVPGVAQRTGATIYYVEMIKPLNNGRKPILAQMPTPGDVDIVLAAELMEAGRSILRGIVTPDRTTLIASNHRSFAIAEKSAPGEGISKSEKVISASNLAAKHQIVFDMNELAVNNGSVISSALFGALAGSHSLPFSKESFIEIISKGKKGVKESIKTFNAAFEHSSGDLVVQESSETSVIKEDLLPAITKSRTGNQLLDRINTKLPAATHKMAWLGLQKVVDYQDADYGHQYIKTLIWLSEIDEKAGGKANNFAFTVQAAKYLSRAMCFDDIIRVADLKTRRSRHKRISEEVKLKDSQFLQTTEFFHPRMEEIVSILPKGFANWLIRRKSLYSWLDKRVSKGRRIKTYSLSGFLSLYFIGGLKCMRRGSLRNSIETEHRNAWLSSAISNIENNYDLATEILGFYRLIKGYSDTHERGLSKFDLVLSTAKKVSHRDDAADIARSLMQAAIKDDTFENLNKTIDKIEGIG